ncbi:MAG: hypothetical protein ACR2QA_05195 [Solirubrobacteraceae bacterium]
MGASIADGLGKPFLGGLGWGDGRVGLGLTIIIIAFVAYLARTRQDVQRHHAVVPVDEELAPAGMGARDGRD